jgi:hypothetical protein
MARRAYWPNMELIKAHLSMISEEDFDAILTAIRKHGAMRNKLEVLNQQWRAAASREGGMDPWLFDLFSIPQKRISDFYSEIEKIIQEEHHRRGAETLARMEVQSRQITDEDMECLRDAKLALIEVILKGNIQSPRERLDVLRLIYLSSQSSISRLVCSSFPE